MIDQQQYVLTFYNDDATRRCGSAGRAANVKNAGAIGAIFTSGLNVFGAGITGDADIPVFQLPKSETDKLQPAVTAGTLNVTFRPPLQWGHSCPLPVGAFFTETA